MKQRIKEQEEKIASLSSSMEKSKSEMNIERTNKEGEFYKYKLHCEEERENLIKSYEEKLDSLSKSNTEAANKQKDDAQQREKALANSYEERITAMQDKFHQAEVQISKLSTTEQMLNEKIQSQAATISEVNAKFDQAKEELKEANGTIVQLTTAKVQYENEVKALQAKIAVMEETMATKTQLVQNTGSSLESLQQTSEQQRNQIDKLLQERVELEKKANERDWIAEKSKHIIEKQREDFQKLMDHYDEKKEYWKQKEQEYEQMTVKLTKSEDEIQNLKRIIETDREQIGKLEDKVKGMQEDAEHKDEELESNRRMIEFLENQLNTKQLDGIDLNIDADGYRDPVYEWKSPELRDTEEDPNNPKIPLDDYLKPISSTGPSIFDNPSFV